MSTNDMARPDRIDLLQGTLDMLILRTLLFGSVHGHQITGRVQRTTEHILNGAPLIPPRSESIGAEGLGAAQVGIGKDRNREFKRYRMTAAGRR